MSIAAMKQAIKALEYPGPSWFENREKAAAALRQAIEQQEKQEPVMRIDWWPSAYTERYIANMVAWEHLPIGTLLYTTPQPQQAEKQKPVADLVECGNCHEGLSDMDHVCKKCLGAGWVRNLDTTPQPQQEPIGTAGELFTNAALERLDFRPSTKLYTTPQPQREWVGLTPDEVFGIADQHPVEGFDPDIMAYTRAIEAKLRSKNT